MEISAQFFCFGESQRVQVGTLKRGSELLFLILIVVTWITLLESNSKLRML